MRLTKAQQRALYKLTEKPQTAFALGESIPTLNALVNRGLATRYRSRLGHMFSPRTSTSYSLKTKEE